MNAATYLNVVMMRPTTLANVWVMGEKHVIDGEICDQTDYRQPRNVNGSGPHHIENSSGLAFHAMCLDMPAKKNHISEEERAKRIREAARELGTSNGAKSFDKAFGKVVTPSVPRSRPSEPKAGT